PVFRHAHACHRVYFQFRGQFLAARFGTKRQGRNEADKATQSADRHWNCETKMPVHRKECDDWCGKAAEYCALMIAEPGRCSAHFGGEALGEVARVLAEDAPTREQPLQREK